MSGARIGLVLGAGGAAGAAYHAGALLALHNDIGWDPRTADVIVGTSIGSIVASLLRAGLSTDDLAAWASDVEPLPAGAPARTLIDLISENPLKLTVPRLAGVLGGVRGAMPGRRWLERPTLAGLATLLPHGVIDAANALGQLGALHDDWPVDPLWMPAVRTRDGRRIVFGRDQHPPLGVAVGASCAIPLLLRPVRIGDDHYIDGAAHSPTNADLLIDAGVDTAIVIAPMSGRREALRRRPDHMVRAAFARRLRREAQQRPRRDRCPHVRTRRGHADRPRHQPDRANTNRPSRPPRVPRHRSADRPRTHRHIADRRGSTTPASTAQQPQRGQRPG